MNINGTNGNSQTGIHLEGPSATETQPEHLDPSEARQIPSTSTETATDTSPVTKFATRAGIKDGDAPSRQKMILIGGGLIAAILFFILTAVLGRSPSNQHAAKQPDKQDQSGKVAQLKGSVTPLMDTVHNQAQDNANGQLTPDDIKRTRQVNTTAAKKPSATNVAKPIPAGSPAASALANVPSFSDTQQRWEEPRPYGEQAPGPALQNQKLATLKEPSIVFVRSAAQLSTGQPKSDANGEDAPLLSLTPGTRIRAKLQTAVSTAIQDTVVAEVEYTYAIGDDIVIPAGTKVYGQLVSADRNGYMNIKFDQLQVLDNPPEKIDALGVGLDLGPIKGVVTGKNAGKNLLVRSVSGIGSTMAMVFGNNTSSSFSEDDLIRERLAENIGTAGDSEIMNMALNSRIVVSAPADTKIYIVFAKHEQSPTGLHKVASTAP